MTESPVLERARKAGFRSLAEKQGKESDDLSDAMSAEKPFQDLFQ